MNAPEQACALDHTLFEHLALGLQSSPGEASASGRDSQPGAAVLFSKPVAGPLAKGQLWQLSDFYVEVVEVTPKLAHYRVLRHRGQKALTRVLRTDALQAYLQEQGAVLAL